MSRPRQGPDFCSALDSAAMRLQNQAPAKRFLTVGNLHIFIYIYMRIYIYIYIYRYIYPLIEIPSSQHGLVRGKQLVFAELSRTRRRAGFCSQCPGSRSFPNKPNQLQTLNPYIDPISGLNPETDGMMRCLADPGCDSRLAPYVRDMMI